MRIIAGELGGRRLKTLPGWQTRPTADKVKGAIFNVLHNKIEGAVVLDLFGGSGNLAIEALSRGAARAVLVEKNRQAARVVQENLQLTSLEERAILINADAFQYLRQDRQTYDLIFLDPPYRHGLVTQALKVLADPFRLTGAGVIVAETAGEEELTGLPALFEVRKTATYGDTKVWYIQRTLNTTGI